MKVCPVCGSALFDDMPVCFGCLYQFGSDPELEKRRSSAGKDDCSQSWSELVDEKTTSVPLAIASPNKAGVEGEHSQVMELPGWIVRVRTEGSKASQTALTVEIASRCDNRDVVKKSVGEP